MNSRSAAALSRQICLAALGIVGGLCGFLVSVALALPPDFDAVKARYLSLRNTDVAYERESEWRTVATDFERFAQAAPRDRSAPQALFNAAIVWRGLAARRASAAELERALAALAAIVERYPNDVLADDALLKRGEIELQEHGDGAAARATWAEIGRRYPDADMRGVAAARLAELAEPRPTPPDAGGVGRAPTASGATAGAAPVLVVLDPGHGGEDTGAEGPGGLLEKDVVLAVAREIKHLLETERGIAVRLTRTDDSFRPLLERTAFANNLGADLFVSLHANAAPRTTLNGVETYYLDTSGGESARVLAERENASVRFEGPAGDLAYMLSDLVQTAKTAESAGLARAIQTGLVRRVRARWPDARDLGVKKALFYVLVGAHMPCALVEIGFMTNPVEGKRIATEEYRRDVARGIFEGIVAYLDAGGAT